MSELLPASEAPPVEGEVLTSKADPVKPWQFKKGVSGNPRGRPPSSRNKISESFLKDLLKWHAKHGFKAIERVGRENPADLLRIIASMIPKEGKVEVDHNIRGGIVLGTIELQEAERRTAELLRRIESGIDPAAGAD